MDKYYISEAVARIFQEKRFTIADLALGIAVCLLIMDIAKKY